LCQHLWQVAEVIRERQLGRRQDAAVGTALDAHRRGGKKRFFEWRVGVTHVSTSEVITSEVITSKAFV
jgi:hypothetical protein